MKKAIFIDPGHGGTDPGCPKGKGEKYYNLEIALRLADRLEQDGWIVGMSKISPDLVRQKKSRICSSTSKNTVHLFRYTKHYQKTSRKDVF